MNWTGGTITGGSLSVAGTLNGTIYATAGVNSQIISGTTLQNSGTISWTSGGILAYSMTSPTLTNLSGGVINFQADGAAFILGSSASGLIVNQGTFSKTGGVSSTGTTVNWFVDFQNGSMILAQSGKLNFIAGGTLDNGTLTLSGSAVAALAGGTFTIPSSATFTSAGTGANYLSWTGGTLTAGSAGGMLAGTLISASGTNAKVIAGNTLFLTGTLAWRGGTIGSASNSTVAIYNLSTGVINFQADGAAFALGTSSTAVIMNQGTIGKTGGFLNSTSVGWAVDFRDGGTLNAQMGTLNFDGGGTLDSGTTTVTGTAVAALDNGTFTVASGKTFSAAGTSGNYLNWTGGTLTGGTLGGTLAGTIISNTGTNTHYIASNTLFNSGTLAWVGGTIYSTPSTTVQFTNLSTGLIDLQTDGTAFALGTSSTANLMNQGTIQKSFGVLNPAIISGWTVSNSGTIQVLVAGTLNFTALVTNTGTVTMVNGATVGGSITSNRGGQVLGPAGGTGTYSGTLTFNSGSILQPGGGQPGGLNLTSNLVMNSGSTLSLNFVNGTPVAGFSTVTVSGNITLNNATLTGNTTNYSSDSSLYFILVNNGSNPISGTFNNQQNGSVVALGAFEANISYFGNFDMNSLTGGNSVVLYNFTPTPAPEPSHVLAIACAALALLAAFRRLRHRQRAWFAAIQ